MAAEGDSATIETLENEPIARRLEWTVEKMQELVDERGTLAERSKRARMDGKYVKRSVADARIVVIDRKLGWYRGRVPVDMHPTEVVQLWETKEAEAEWKREEVRKKREEADAAEAAAAAEADAQGEPEPEGDGATIETLENEAIAEAVEAAEAEDGESEPELGSESRGGLMSSQREALRAARGGGGRRRADAIDEDTEGAAAFEVVTRTTKSGVRVSDDFRDNLIIDRYDQVFATMRGLKLRHLRSENSEDAVTWNVFRSLRQVDPAVWLPGLARRGLQGAEPPPAVGAVLSLWLSVSPPPALLAGGDEGNSEIDVAIESPSWVWFIETKYRSDIETGTKTRPERDQVLRNIDVGSYYAGTRDFFFSLLVVSPETSPVGAAAVAEYSDFSKTRALLQAHRSDRLTNLRAVTLLTWLDMAAVLTDARDSVVRIDERHYADRALEWMRVKGLAG